MKKTKALFLFWLFLIFSLELHELVKIVYFIQHFHQHQELNLAEFIHVHYYSNTHNDLHHHFSPVAHTHAAHEDHQHLPPAYPHQHPAQEHKLPFSKSVNYFSLFVFIHNPFIVFLPKHSIFSFIAQQKFILQQKFIAIIRWFCSGYKLALFRPPR